jgi:surface protein
VKKLNNYIQEKLILTKHNVIFMPETRLQLMDIIEDKCRESNIIDVSDIDISNLKRSSLGLIFSYNTNLEEVTGLDTWDVGEIKKMHQMFYECENLKKIDISNWDISNVERFDGMFGECKNLEDIGDISNWKIKDNADVSGILKNTNFNFKTKYMKYFRKK